MITSDLNLALFFLFECLLIKPLEREMWEVLDFHTKELLLLCGTTIYDDFKIVGVNLGIGEECLVEYRNGGETVYTLTIRTPFARKLNE